MNPDSLSTDNLSQFSSMDTSSVNLDPTHLLWTTIATLVISHIGAVYLAQNTPRGYWFWFTILNLVVGFLFL